MDQTPDNPRASVSDVRRFLDILHHPKDERSGADTHFAKQFADRWFYRDGVKLTPKRIMEKTPELWEAYLLWDRVQKQEGTPTLREKAEHRKGRERRKVSNDVPDDEQSSDRAPTTRAGEVLQTLDASGRLDDETAHRIASRDNGEGTVRRARTIAKWTMAGLLLVGGGVGVRSMFAGKQAAENIGGDAQRHQDAVGNFAIEAGTDPLNAPIPGSLEAKERERRNQKAKDQSSSPGARK